MRSPHPQPAAEFARNIRRTHPVAGPTWLRDLSHLQQCLSTRWELKLERWLPGARGACVLKAVTAAGDDVVLKIPVIASDTTSEGRALDYWDGVGAPRLLQADPASGALLIEWVAGRPFVEEADTTASLRTAGAYLRELHRPRARSYPQLPALEEKLAPWRRSRDEEEAKRGGPALDEATIRREVAVRTWLADTASAAGVTVIHGDLHPRNLLVASGALVAIDPYGLTGEPARDAAQLALSFREDAMALRRLDTIADFAGVERARVVAHAYALAVGAHRFRSAYGISSGRAFLESVVRDLEPRLAGVVDA